MLPGSKIILFEIKSTVKCAGLKILISKIHSVQRDLTRKKLEIKLSNGDIITDDLAVKILGWWVNTENSMNDHVNRIRGNVYRNLADLKPI